MTFEKYKQAGEIAKKTKAYAKEIIEPGKKLYDIAEEIEDKIKELGGEIAFPTNLSIDDIAAHSTPEKEDDEAKGLLKIDIGVHIDGYIADTAFSIDLEDSEENKKLIQASDEALEKGIENIDKELMEIGGTIQKTIENYGFSSIKNLQGHKLDKYDLHAGINIPNYNNNNDKKLPEGYYAIEPFSTTGKGEVYEGKPSGIYRVINHKPVRLNRDILDFIKKYRGLPFCSKWVINKFGRKAKIALKRFEKEKIVMQYPQLVEKNHGKVAQSEHTIYFKDKARILT